MALGERERERARAFLMAYNYAMMRTAERLNSKHFSLFQLLQRVPVVYEPYTPTIDGRWK